MRYEAFMGTDEFLYSGEVSDLSDRMVKFMESINDGNGTGTFEIKEEIIHNYPLYYAEVNIPSWTEALFLIQFYEYNWELTEESE